MDGKKKKEAPVWGYIRDLIAAVTQLIIDVKKLEERTPVAGLKGDRGPPGSPVIIFGDVVTANITVADLKRIKAREAIIGDELVKILTFE
jgi:hypothetical protein